MIWHKNIFNIPSFPGTENLYNFQSYSNQIKFLIIQFRECNLNRNINRSISYGYLFFYTIPIIRSVNGTSFITNSDRFFATIDRTTQKKFESKRTTNRYKGSKLKEKWKICNGLRGKERINFT